MGRKRKASSKYEFLILVVFRFDFVLLSLSLVGLCLESKYYFLATLRPIKLIR